MPGAKLFAADVGACLQSQAGANIRMLLTGYSIPRRRLCACICAGPIAIGLGGMATEITNSTAASPRFILSIIILCCFCIFSYLYQLDTFRGDSPEKFMISPQTSLRLYLEEPASRRLGLSGL
jgi:hypothetical protein